MAPPLLSLGTKGNSLTDIIITILYQHHPLSSKRIHHLAAAYGANVTYQAVFKKLQQMLADGIVQKTGMEYSLNIDWIKKLKRFAEEMEKTYESTGMQNTKETENFIMTFSTPIEALTSLLDFLVQEYEKDPSPDVTVVHWVHPWPVICISKTEYEKIKNVMTKGVHYGLCKNSTPLDKWLAKFWEDLGKKHAYDPSVAGTCDLLVFRDYAVQIFVNPEAAREIDAIFTATEDVNKLDTNAFYKNIMERKADITVIVTKSRTIADVIRKQTIEKFKE